MKKKIDFSAINLIEQTAKNLFNEGFSRYQISKIIGIDLREVVKILPSGTPQKNLIPSRTIHDAILESGEVGCELIIETEKQRFDEYRAIEAKCLKMMARLLDYYNQVEIGDLKTDSFRATLANNFIKATHDVRAELLKKYEIDKTDTNAGANTIKVDWIATDEKMV